MAANPARYGVPKATEPVSHDLPPFSVGGIPVAVRLSAWRADDGSWRGRLVFGPPGKEVAATADIFCAGSESDLWQSVRDLREHHLRALYRSLVP